MNSESFKIILALLCSHIAISIGASLPQTNPFPSTRECAAARSNKIYGGVETEIDEFPWMALIEYEKSELF